MQAVLFCEIPSGMPLTEGPGRGRRAGDAQATAENVCRAVRSVGQGRSGIGAPAGLPTYLLPQVCARLVARNPGLDIQIRRLARRVFNLSRRRGKIGDRGQRADGGRLVVQKNCRLSTAVLPLPIAYLAERPEGYKRWPICRGTAWWAIIPE